MKVDLHTHSTASDGVLSPSGLVDYAAQVGVSILALTDHDTTDGLAEAQAAAQRRGLELIPGIEINTEHPGGSLDILGYWIPTTPGPFQQRLAELRDARLTRGQRMVDKLHRLGAPVRWERVQELSQGSMGRPHIARALVEEGHVSSVNEAFELYLGHGRPAYVPRTRLTVFEAVRFIRENGGAPVMAHPIPTQAQHLDPFGLAELLPRLKKVGLVGIDAYYGTYTPETVRRLVELAERLGLVPAGGSDFHGPDMGATLGSTGVPVESVERLRAVKT